MLGGILLAGIPGEGFLALVDLLLSPFDLHVDRILGDNHWPAAILIGLSWPAPFVPVSVLLFRLFPRMPWSLRVLAGAVACLLFGLAIAFLLVLVAM